MGTYKVKRIYFRVSTQDILLTQFSPLGATFLKKVSPQPPTKNYLLVFYYESKLQHFLVLKSIGGRDDQKCFPPKKSFF